MRSIILLVVLATLAAGCAKPGTPTTTTPTSPSAGGTGNTTGTPVPVKTDTHDFTTDAASGASTKFTVPAGVTTLNVTVKFAPAGPAPASLTNGITVKVGGASCTLAAGPVQGSSTCTKMAPASGVGSIDYSGAGPVVATVTITGT